MKDYAILGVLTATWLAGLYAGLCLGYVICKWDNRFRRWCERHERRLLGQESLPHE